MFLVLHGIKWHSMVLHMAFHVKLREGYLTGKMNSLTPTHATLHGLLFQTDLFRLGFVVGAMALVLVW